MNGFYSAPVHIWSGLLSGGIYRWQKGLRRIAAEIGDVSFHPTESGYGDWEIVAQTLISKAPESVVLVGHSNGAYAITSVAEALKPHGIKCYLVCFDRTRKACPPLGSNVPEAIDLYAGLRRLQRGPDFTGNLTVMDFKDESHIGVIGNEDAQRIAIAFGRKWKTA